MSQGRQTSADTSYGRSAGQAAGRGLLLLVGAVIVGWLLLRGVNDKPSVPSASPVTTADTAAAADVTAAVPADGSSPVTSPVTPTVTRRAPAMVNVLVINGSGKNRAASKVADNLKTSSYNVRKSVDANSPTLAATVYFNPDFQTEASDIALILGISGMIQPMPTPEPIKAGIKAEPHDILVVVDAAMAARFAGAATGTGAAPTATAGPAA